MKHRRLRLVLAGAVMLSSLTGACGTDDEAAPRPPCESPTKYDLGVVLAKGTDTMFSTGGGDLYLGIDGLGGNGAFAATKSEIFVGKADDPPVTREGGKEPLNASASKVVELGRLSMLHLQRGRYWVVSSNYGRVWIEACPPVTVEVIRTASYY